MYLLDGSLYTEILIWMKKNTYVSERQFKMSITSLLPLLFQLHTVLYLNCTLAKIFMPRNTNRRVGQCETVFSI